MSHGSASSPHRHSGARASANPKSRADDLGIPVSLAQRKIDEDINFVMSPRFGITAETIFTL
jgi:hypothetical protein